MCKPATAVRLTNRNKEVSEARTSAQAITNNPKESMSQKIAKHSITLIIFNPKLCLSSGLGGSTTNSYEHTKCSRGLKMIYNWEKELSIITLKKW